MVFLILGAVIVLLALIALIPQTSQYPVLSVAVLLAGVALIVLGYGGR